MLKSIGVINVTGQPGGPLPPINEARTRKEMIDSDLEIAGWYLVDLYQEPLTNFGEDAVDRWFNPKELDELIHFTSRVSI